MVYFPFISYFYIMKDNINLKIKFGKNLKEYRCKAGYTQESLAAKTGVSSTAISSIETGKSFPTYKNLIALLKVLNIPACRMFTFAEDVNMYLDDEKKLLYAQIFNDLNNDNIKKLIEFATFLKSKQQ